MRMTGRISTGQVGLIGLLPLTFAILLGLACGGGSSGEDGSGTPTATASPTVTASTTPGESTSTPIPTAEPTATPAPQVEVSPVDPFDIRSAEAINVRDIPATAGNLVTVIFPGETATVLGEAVGEEVEAGDVKWFQVEIMREGGAIQGFLYAAYVVAI